MGKSNNKTSSALLFKRYIWLVDIISSFGPITLKEINERWLDSILNEEKLKLPRETFIHHKEAIQTIFDIDIVCNSKNEYFIDTQIEEEKQNSVRRMLINSLSLSGLVNENKNIKNLIQMEDSYINNNLVRIIVEAISNKQYLNIFYNKFGANRQEYIIQPLCLKTFRQRWYLVCRVKESENMYTFGLERITSMEKSNLNFKPDKNFDSHRHFQKYFGITADQSIKPELIEVHVTERQADYLRTAPIHNSQEEKGRAGDQVIFTYYVAPTYEFEMEILRFSKELKVVSPESFRKRIGNVMREIVKGYE